MLNYLKINTKKRKTALMFFATLALGLGFFFLDFETTQAGFWDDWKSGPGIIWDKFTGTTVGYAVTNPIDFTVKSILQAVLTFFSWLVAVAAMLLGWVLNPEHVSGPDGLYNATAIEGGWKIIRDFLNLAFIFVLLFSAFSTIFQYEKYHLKKVIWTLVLMALLVNFSYPITRFIIDISNVVLYFFVESFFGGDIYNVSTQGYGIYAQFLGETRFDKIIMPENYYKYEITALLAMIVFTFIMAFTLLTISILMLVRMFGFAILIITSPIAFVSQILPGSKQAAEKWWDSLIRLSIMGPGLMFVVFIATYIMKEVSSESMDSIAVSNANANSSSVIATMAFLLIPIAILWLGIMKVIEYGGFAGGAAKKIMSKPGDFGRASWKWTGIPGGVKSSWQQARQSGTFRGQRIPFLRDTLGEREAAIAGRITSGKLGQEAAERAAWKEERTKGAKYYDKFTDSDRNNMLNPTSDAYKKLNGRERAKVAQSLMNTNDINADNLYNVLRATGPDPKNEMKKDILKNMNASGSVKTAEDLNKAIDALNRGFGRNPQQQADIINGVKNIDQLMAKSGNADMAAIMNNLTSDNKSLFRKQAISNGRVDLLVDFDVSSGKSATSSETLANLDKAFANINDANKHKKAWAQIGSGNAVDTAIQQYINDLNSDSVAGQTQWKKMFGRLDNETRRAILLANPTLKPV